MPSIVEIKARVSDADKLTAKVLQFADTPVAAELIQEDTFFHVNSGRLKLRQSTSVLLFHSHISKIRLSILPPSFLSLPSFPLPGANPLKSKPGFRGVQSPVVKRLRCILR